MSEETNLPEAAFFRLPRGYIMRPVQADDAPYIYRWVNDPETRPYHNRALIESITDEVDWVQGLGKRKLTNQVWMIVSAEGTRIGTMGLHNISWKDGTASTGAIFGVEKHRNQGIGTLAKMALLNHAFNVQNLRAILSEAVAFNIRSINYSLKCGYVEIGRIPHWIFWEGHYYDHVMLLATRATWEPIWQRHQAEHGIETFTGLLSRHGQVVRNS